MKPELHLDCASADGTVLTVKPFDTQINLSTDDDEIHLTPGDARELATFLMEQAKAIEARHPETKEVHDIMPFICLVNKLEKETEFLTREEAAGYRVALQRVRERASLRWA